jgi:hypothetical protein
VGLGLAQEGVERIGAFGRCQLFFAAQDV